MEKYESKFWTKSYDAHVKPSLEYPTEGLGALYLRGMELYPNRPACWFMAREISYKELLDYVKIFATFLQKNGLEKGDVVAINMPNCPQYMIALFGTFLAGGIASGCSFLLSEDEIAYQLNDCGAKFIVTLDAIYAGILRKILKDVPKLKYVITTNLAEYMGFSKIKVILGKLLKKIPSGKVKPFPGKKVVKFQDVMLTTIDVKEVKIDAKKDLALLQYTGGTTGRPKGTEVTHANVSANLHQVSTWIELDKEKDLGLSGWPMFHAAGLMFCQMSVYNSMPQIIIVNPRDTGHIIEEIMDKKPTIIANVPTLYLNIKNDKKVKKIPKSILDNIRFYVSSAAPFPAESILDFEKAMKAEGRLMEMYGLTETGPALTSNPYLGKKKVGSVGLALPDVELKIVNLDTGEPVDIGKPGEILCKGPQITRGYYNKPEANKKAFDADGYFRTGDVGVMDEDGYISIVDRTKDMLIVSGYKVYSVHVEDILTKHPDIELVALIGIPDKDRPGSEIVKAYVTLKKGVKATDEVKENVKQYAEKELSKYEKPKIWEFRDELPLTTVGKVLKRELREEIQK